MINETSISSETL
jgi:dynein heavy chain 1